MPNDLVESSMNFDLENVRPFLARIAPLIEGGFGAAEIDRVVSLAEKMQHDEEQSLTFQIKYRGQPSPFRVGIFMDDIDAPDMYFFAPAGLAEQIDGEMERSCEELGI
jgi:hypothetical protein